MSDLAQLFLPQAALSGLFFAGIGRDTRGAALTGDDLFNHFPASPLIALSVVLSGETHMARGDGLWQLPAVSLAGAQSAPTVSWTPGPVAALTLGFYPDAFERLTGVNPESLKDRVTGDIPAPLSQVAEAMRAAPTPGAAYEAAETKLAALWDDAGSPLPARLTAWVRGALSRAALSGPGTSLRAQQRRIARAFGQTRQSLEHFSRIEALHARVSTTRPASLADLAVDMGYADQSHMGRDVKRATGFSPAELNRRIETDESFWCYRLLGARF